MGSSSRGARRNASSHSRAKASSGSAPSRGSIASGEIGGGAEPLRVEAEGVEGGQEGASRGRGEGSDGGNLTRLGSARGPDRQVAGDRLRAGTAVRQDETAGSLRECAD